MSNSISINLNKYISDRGVCSRREAEKLIIEGRVTINDKPTKLGNRVFNNDIVKIDGKEIKAKPKTYYIAYNKPPGIVSTTDTKEPLNIVNQINHNERLFPIGRLDKYSEGLIFLTNDGNIVNKILRAGNHHEKEYIVKVNNPINQDFINKMSNGIPILGTITKKCEVNKINDYTFKIILIQGLNRQIRRMCEHLDYKVASLKRVRIMNITLKGLKSGEWREFTQKEEEIIKKLVTSSSKTKEASVDLNKISNPKNKYRFKK